MTHLLVAAHGTPQTEISSLSPEGAIEWSRTEQGHLYEAKLSASGRSIVAAGPALDDHEKRHPCLLRGFAAANGQGLWQSYLTVSPIVDDLPYTAPGGCRLKDLWVTTRGGVLLAQDPKGWLFVGFDPDTGSFKWQRLVGPMAPSGFGVEKTLGREEPPVFWSYLPGDAEDRVALVTADAQTGQVARFAIVIEPRQSMPEGYSMSIRAMRWGYGALIAVGSLTGLAPSLPPECMPPVEYTVCAPSGGCQHVGGLSPKVEEACREKGLSPSKLFILRLPVQ